MYKIVWSEEAKLGYQQIQNFVLQKWSINTVLSLDNEVEHLLQLLKVQQQLCPILDEYPGLRKCVINKQNSLIYRIDTAHNIIYLIAFIDNRMEHTFFN